MSTRTASTPPGNCLGVTFPSRQLRGRHRAGHGANGAIAPAQADVHIAWGKQNIEDFQASTYH